MVDCREAHVESKQKLKKTEAYEMGGGRFIESNPEEHQFDHGGFCLPFGNTINYRTKTFAQCRAILVDTLKRVAHARQNWMVSFVPKRRELRRFAQYVIK